MTRRAPLVTLLRRRILDTEDRRRHEVSAWQQQWREALQDASGQAAAKAVADRVARDVHERQRRQTRLEVALRDRLLAHRAAFRTSVTRLFRDAADRMAVAPFLGADPARTQHARDAALVLLVRQWTATVEATVAHSTAQQNALAAALPWSDASNWPSLLAALGRTVHPLPSAPKWASPVVSARRVLVDDGDVFGPGPTGPLDAAAQTRITAWGERAAVQGVADGGVAPDLVADTWARL